MKNRKSRSLFDEAYKICRGKLNQRWILPTTMLSANNIQNLLSRRLLNHFHIRFFMKRPESSIYFCITGLEVKMTNECVFDNIRTGFPLQVQIVENSETTDMRQE